MAEEKYGRGKHPNSVANLKHGKRFGPGDDPVKKKGRETAAANTAAWKSISAIITNELEKDDCKLKEAMGRRVLKMALEGNLAAIQYVVKLIGEEPVQEIAVSTGTFDALDKAFTAMGGEQRQ